MYQFLLLLVRLALNMLSSDIAKYYVCWINMVIDHVDG